VDIEQIKEITKDLMTALEDSDISKLAIKTEGFELTLECNRGTFMPTHTFHGAMPMSSSMESHGRIESQPLPHVEPDRSKFITSPVVGTFYYASSPDDPPFIKIGDKVEEDTVVGIIEAMKVMNEMKARIKGVIVEVLVDNGQPVEFGTRVFRIE
jgi:acetyl-CoA carboxylase biotin carboxyl carrier protein